MIIIIYDDLAFDLYPNLFVSHYPVTAGKIPAHADPIPRRDRTGPDRTGSLLMKKVIIIELTRRSRF